MSFKLLVITPPKEIPCETEQVIKLFENGLKTLHLRKPGADADQIIQYLEQIPYEFHPRIVLHSHYFLNKTFHLKGIHLNSIQKEDKTLLNTALPAQDIRGIPQTISCSCHSIEEVETIHPIFNYAFLSPIFDSISKSGYTSTFSAEDLTHLPLAVKKRGIALGGCNERNMEKIKMMGFQGAAVLGAIWNCSSPIEAFINLKKVIQTLDHP